jgi:hypothetical protein
MNHTNWQYPPFNIFAEAKLANVSMFSNTAEKPPAQMTQSRNQGRELSGAQIPGYDKL